MYGLLLQVHPTLCTVVLTVRLRVVIQHIPSQMVLCLYFGLAVSSTMGSAFLDHVVRDRERASNLSLLNFLLDSLSTKNCPQVQYTIP